MLHQSCKYTMTLRGDNLDIAVLYLLRLLKKYHLPTLTHNQVARITGYSRFHATKAMSGMYRDHANLLQELEGNERK